VARSCAPPAVHAVQLAPHAFTKSSGRHSPLQATKPALQKKPQLVPSHDAIALAGTDAEHGVQLLPQVFTSVFERH